LISGFGAQEIIPEAVSREGKHCTIHLRKEIS